VLSAKTLFFKERLSCLQGKRPALVDNLIQSIMMAPYFVLLESVEPLFGYEPSRGFSQRVRAAIEEKNQAEKEQRER
jgi:uncharacterized membrane protein YGL010W